MNSQKSIKLAALLLCFISVTGIANAQKPATNVTMHRQAAGELDDDGWTLATSTGGRYSVKIPAKFNDFTVAHEDPKFIVEKSEVINGVTLQGIRLTTTRAHFRGGKETARKLFDRLKMSAGKPPYKSLKPMRMNEYAALEGEIENKRGLALQRTVLLDDDLFTMLVEYSKPQEAVAKRLAPIFFESVRVQ